MTQLRLYKKYAGLANPIIRIFGPLHPSWRLDNRDQGELAYMPLSVGYTCELPVSVLRISCHVLTAWSTRPL